MFPAASYASVKLFPVVPELLSRSRVSHSFALLKVPVSSSSSVSVKSLSPERSSRRWVQLPIWLR
jgi:hypothetical protein